MSASFSLAAFWHRQCATLAVLLGRQAAALSHWQKIHALRPDDPGVLATLAHLTAARGGRDQAITLLERAIGLDDGRAPLWFNYGFLVQQRDDHPGAIAAFDRAIALDPKLDRAWYGKALSLIKLQRIDEAIVALRRNTELQPMSPYGWYQLGHAYHRLGQTDKLQTVIRRLSGFEPKVAEQLTRETG